MSTSVNPDPSMADLRAMVTPAAVEAPTETKPAEAAEAVVEAAEPDAAAPADTKQEPEKDDELPEGVKKRIAKEAEKAARIQSEIDRAVSKRKAKEAELASLNGKPGSEPDTTTAPAKDAKPIKPVWGQKDDQTWAQYQEALATYETKHDEWLTTQTRKAVQEELTAKAQKDAAQARWDEAVKVHGAEFPELMTKAQETAPEGLQVAISGLDNWSGVAVYLAKNPARLAEVAAKYGANPVAAIAELGRIEASLKTVSKPVADKPLPKPPVTDGGNASATTGAVDLETLSMSQFKKAVGKMANRS